MEDRIPTPGQEGRVLITPENGSPYYAKIAMADNPTQAGTPLNKDTLLKDATAGLYGLGSDAVPDDVLSLVGKYNQHWWRRRKPVGGWSITGSTIDGEGSNESPYAYILYVYASSNAESTAYNIQYSDELDVSNSGSILGLKAPVKTLSLSHNTYTNAQQLRGKYFMRRYENTRFSNQSADRGIAYLPKNAIIKNESPYNTEAVVFPDTLMVDLKTKSVPGDWEYLQSSSRSAYPDSGESGGYEYQYLGIPFENAVGPMVQIATGSYTGTGTYGEDNPNSLTFDFEPSFVLIATTAQKFWAVFSPFILSNSYVSGGYGVLGASDNWTNNYARVIENTLSWYGQNIISQNNQSGITYTYVALG